MLNWIRKRSLFVIMILMLFLIVSNSGVFAQDKSDTDKSITTPIEEINLSDQDSLTTEHIVRSSFDVEDHDIHMTVAPTWRNYKKYDGSNNKTSIPTLIRADIARDWELWVLSDTYTKQYPKTGFNDVAAGIKWQFSEKNPSQALYGGVRFNTASCNVGDGATEPRVAYLLDYKINDKWMLSANITWAYLYDGVVFQRYNQLAYAAQATYNLNKRSQFVLIGSSSCPDNSPTWWKGVNVMSATAGYVNLINKDTNWGVYVTKGLSPIDINWLYTLGATFKIGEWKQYIKH